MSLSRWRQILGQSPGVAVLLQAMHDIICNSVTLFLSEFFTQSTHKFAGAPQREGDCEAQKVPAGAH
jgi:hypothetical protein